MLNLRNFDWLLLLVILLILFLGAITVLSVNPQLFATHVFYCLLAVLVFFLFALIDFKIFENLGKVFYLISFLLLLTPLFLGVLSRGATRWIQLGGYTFQPSEASKFLMIIFLASYWFFRKMNWRNFFICFLSLLPQFFLIFRQPDLGSSLVLLSIFFGTLFLTEISGKQILILIFAFLVITPFGWLFLKDYQKQRIVHFLNPSADPLGAGYNIIQAVLTVGSGGFIGKGFGKGSQSHLAFLPERHTDFIFASFAEEFGFIGSLFLVFLYFLLLQRILRLVKNLDDKFALFICQGVFAFIFFQAVVNIGMNLGLLPITGITLPLFSWGGSSLISTMACLGLVESVARNTGKKEIIEIGRHNF